MRTIFHATVLIFLTCVCAWGYNPLSPEKEAELRERADATPLENRLADIVKRQQTLLEKEDALSESEIERTIAELSGAYTQLLRDHPDNLLLLLHYGKFLRMVGEDKGAVTVFERVRKLDDSVAVAYQQLANIHAENGRYHEAWPLLQTCLKLAPDVALYHYQMGEFLNVFGEYLVSANLLKADELSPRLQAEFKRALELDPTSARLAERYAQSFYQVPEPDWKRRLAPGKKRSR